ncbi:hypothetical protein BH09BAC3_BH09BAC3_32370 [soil metagenome]
MENHKRVLGILYIVSGTLQIVGLLIASALINAFFPLLAEQADADAQWVLVWIVPFFTTIAVIVVIFFSIPAIIAGWGLLNSKKWALTLALILGCFKLFSFPIGTALGIYTIWVYTQENRSIAQA